GIRDFHVTGVQTCALPILVNGINNGGGEYREYIWPVMTLFAIGLILTTINFYKTIASRNTDEIYISNWYILGACVWTIVLVTIRSEERRVGKECMTRSSE